MRFTYRAAGPLASAVAPAPEVDSSGGRSSQPDNPRHPIAALPGGISRCFVRETNVGTAFAPTPAGAAFCEGGALELRTTSPVFAQLVRRDALSPRAAHVF